jgi:phage baseplate assembly protein W
MPVDQGRVIGQGISFPPRLGRDGRWAFSSGDTNVRESVRVVLTTELGERVMLPEYGGSLGRFLFEPNTVATRHLIADRIGKALAVWEPRLRVESIDVDEDPADPQAAVVTIVYRLVATQARERVALTVSLAR